ncbi:MAG TPA: multiheme c-type cytochrome, partial [Pirellulales bacterium]
WRSVIGFDKQDGQFAPLEDGLPSPSSHEDGLPSPSKQEDGSLGSSNQTVTAWEGHPTGKPFPALFGKTGRWRSACRSFCSIAALGLSLALAAKQGRAQEPAYLGSERCLDCHTQPGPRRERDGATDWVKLTEAHTWLEIDKHSLAFDVLKGERSQTMSKRLGYDVSQDDRCLSCHAGVVKEHPRPKGRELELGVSCEACHGPSSLYDLPHTSASWRAKSAQEKAALGMIDVRDPLPNSEQCLSCHVGNAAEGKVLTHSMYAAGHPPLPSFEAATFAQSMPPHWRRLKDKGDRVRADAELQRISHEAGGEIPEVRSVVIGGVAALRASLRLLVDRRTADQATGGWPDFAQYDCATCHHELELPSWRQKRTTGRRPGELLPPAWPTVLAELAAHEIERHDAALGKRLAAEFQAALIGELPDLGAVLAAIDQMLPALEKLPYNEAAAEALLGDLCQSGQRPDLDFDSARQVGWAFEAIYSAVFGEPIDGSQKADLARLRRLLALDLPATRDKAILDRARQRRMFEAIGDFQPGQKQEVGRIFASLARRLPSDTARGRN